MRTRPKMGCKIWVPVSWPLDNPQHEKHFALLGFVELAFFLEVVL